MNEKKRDTVAESAEERKPYEPPAIEHTAEFETLALQCTQLDGNSDCYGGYKFS